MNVLIWHVHGSYMTALVRGPHRWLIPVLPDRGPDGRGRARTWDWPASAVELAPEDLATEDVDLVVLQRPEDEGLANAWLGGRRVGRDVPAVWLEHNAPQGRIAELRHPAADRDDVTVVHVTPTNALFWDTGTTATRVIEHGVVDPGERYEGDLPRAAVAINEPLRRGRVTGTDLLAGFAGTVPIDLFGMQVDRVDVPGVHAHGEVTQQELHGELSRRRVYLHPVRWTSLGLTLVEAMLLGMPVVALATLEVPDAVPPEAGVVSNHPDVLAAALRRFVDDPEAARLAGKAARAAALERYGLERFLADWNAVIAEVAR